MKFTISKSAHTALRLATLGLAALALFSQLLAFAVSYQSDSNYFDRGAILPIASSVLATVAALLGTVDAILSGKEDVTHKDALRITALPAGVGFAVAGIHLLTVAVSTLGIITAILLIFGALYCILDCIGIEKFGSIAVIIGFTAVLGCAGLTGYHYFDHTVELNAPIKTSLQVALLCAMLFFTGELRCRLGTPAPRMYRMLTAWTIASGVLASLPLLLAFLIGKLERIDYLTAALLVLGITVTATVRYCAILVGEHRNADMQNDRYI